MEKLANAFPICTRGMTGPGVQDRWLCNLNKYEDYSVKRVLKGLATLEPGGRSLLHSSPSLMSSSNGKVHSHRKLHHENPLNADHK